MSDIEGLSFMLAMGGTLLFFFFVFCLALYLLQSLGLYKMAEKLAIENAWLAFIPVVHTYIMGKLSGRVKLGTWEVNQPELVLPIGIFLGMVLAPVPIIGTLFNLAVMVLYVAVLYELFKQYKPENAVLYTVVGFVIPPLLSVFIFILRNVEPVSGQKENEV